MQDKAPLSAPVVVGGIGGSGTRVVAQMLVEMGFYMGRDLLKKNYDNLWFTFLLNRPKWFMNRGSKNKELVFARLDLAVKNMIDPFRPSPRELGLIAPGIADFVLAGQHIPRRVKKKKARIALRQAWRTLRTENVDLSEYVGWGWKEPNSHIYIQHLNEHFQNLKFIYVIRHGLDMAYSKNKNQLLRWGDFFDIKVSPLPESLPKAALEYWIKASHRAISLGEQMGPGKFLSLNFDELCASPLEGTRQIAAFLDLDADKLDMETLCSIPKPPESTGRYRTHDLSIFTQEDIDAVRELGFEVEIR